MTENADTAAAALGPWEASWEKFTSALRDHLGPPLKSFFAPLDRFLDRLPMGVAQACAVGLFLLAAAWVWSLKREYVYLGAPDRARWRDLRIWATLVLAPYIVIYLVLGR